MTCLAASIRSRASADTATSWPRATATTSSIESGSPTTVGTVEQASSGSPPGARPLAPAGMRSAIQSGMTLVTADLVFAEDRWRARHAFVMQGGRILATGEPRELADEHPDQEREDWGRVA